MADFPWLLAWQPVFAGRGSVLCAGRHRRRPIPFALGIKRNQCQNVARATKVAFVWRVRVSLRGGVTSLAQMAGDANSCRDRRAWSNAGNYAEVARNA